MVLFREGLGWVLLPFVVGGEGMGVCRKILRHFFSSSIFSIGSEPKYLFPQQD